GEMTSKGASATSEHDSVAAAIEDHYRPLGPNDRVPTDRVAITLALADKLDTLAGFWTIDEKPTGSSDPYALRRAALGIVRTILSNGVRLSLGRAEITALEGPGNVPVWSGALLQAVFVNYFGPHYFREGPGRIDRINEFSRNRQESGVERP